MNCLFTLNIKNAQGWNAPFIGDNVRKTYIAACHRWGCNYAEINHDHNPDDKICNWGKIRGPKLLIGYDKLLYLDGDMKISEHAPNPFDLCVDDDTMYAVADAQGVNLGNSFWEDVIYRAGAHKVIERYPEFSMPPVDKYFNTGFMLFKNTDKIRETFDFIDQNREFEVPTCYDQTVINIIVHNRLKVVILPEKWNYIVWSRDPDPEAYINHYAHAGAVIRMKVVLLVGFGIGTMFILMVGSALLLQKFADGRFDPAWYMIGFGVCILAGATFFIASIPFPK